MNYAYNQSYVDVCTDALLEKRNYPITKKGGLFMKKKILGLLICISVMVFFSSCKNIETSEDTYTVWTDVSNYTEFQNTFGDLDDGMYTRFNISASGWKQLSSSLDSTGRHNWDKGQIKDWFIGRGFGEYESTKETAWLTSSDHGMIASRTKNTVYYILK